MPQVAIQDEIVIGSFLKIEIKSLELRQAVYLASLKSGPTSPNTANFVNFVETQAESVVSQLG